MTGNGEWQNICGGIDAIDVEGGCSFQLAQGSNGANPYETVYEPGFHGVWATYSADGSHLGDNAYSVLMTCDDAETTTEPTTVEPTTVETTIDDSNCGYSIDDGGWTLVRHTYNKWFQSTDGLRGTAVYGTDCGPVCDDEFSIAFDAVNETEFLFSSGDCDRWMITTYDQFVFHWGSNYEATILKSHISDVPYTALWCNRGNLEDPWISYLDHWDEQYGDTTIMYGENSYSGNAAYTDSHMNVWVRDAVLPTTEPTTAEPTTSGPTTAQPTQEPTKKPTTYPTKGPTSEPISDPTKNPTADPTQDPTTSAPSRALTQFSHLSELVSSSKILLKIT